MFPIHTQKATVGCNHSLLFNNGDFYRIGMDTSVAKGKYLNIFQKSLRYIV